MKDATLQGYASIFYCGTPETEYALAPGVTERVAPGAFTRTLREHPDVFALLAHDSAKPIGRTTSDPVSLYLRVNPVGLLADILPVDTADGDDAVSLVKSRVLRGMSFGFQCVADEWVPGPNGTAIRVLKDVELLEVSAVTFPAYKGTTLEISKTSRSLTHTLGAYARRVQSLIYEPRTIIHHKGPTMIERADERRNADKLLTQSRLRLYDRRVKLISERESLHLLPAAKASVRDSKIAAELIELLREERNLAQCSTARNVEVCT